MLGLKRILRPIPTYFLIIFVLILRRMKELVVSFTQCLFIFWFSRFNIEKIERIGCEFYFN